MGIAGGNRKVNPKAMALWGLAGLLLFSPSVFAKIHITDLGGVDWFSESSPDELLNPLHGVVFSESGLLENLGEVEHDDDTDAVKFSHIIIKTLFHRLPSGYVPSDAPNKVAYYLHPKLIGQLLGEYQVGRSLPAKAKGGAYDAIIKELFLADSLVAKKLRSEQAVFCRASDGGLNNSPFTQKKRTQLCNGRKAKEGDLEYMWLASVLKDDLRRFFRMFLSANHSNPLVARAMLALLWHKVTSKADFAAYYEGLSTAKGWKGTFLPPANWEAMPLESPASRGGADADGSVDRTTPAGAAALRALHAEQRDKLLLLQLGNEQTLVKQAWAHYKSGSWPDCGASSLRNFIRIVFAKQDKRGMEYDVEAMKKAGLAGSVLEHFRQFNTHDSQLKQDARDDWGTRTCGLSKVEYDMDIEGTWCEIRPGADNMLQTLKALLVNNSKQKAPTNWPELFARLPGARLLDENINSDGVGSLNFKVGPFEYRWNFLVDHFYVQRFEPLSTTLETDAASAQRDYVGRNVIERGVLAALELDSFLKRSLVYRGGPSQRREMRWPMIYSLRRTDEAIIEYAPYVPRDKPIYFKSLASSLRRNEDAVYRLGINLFSGERSDWLAIVAPWMTRLGFQPPLFVKSLYLLPEGSWKNINSLTISAGLSIASDGLSFGKLAKHFPNLTDLYITETPLKQISSIGDLKKLTSLALRDTDIADISPLATMTHLETLDLSRNEKIESVAALTKLIKLKELRLNGTSITSLEPLIPLKNARIYVDDAVHFAQATPKKATIPRELVDQVIFRAPATERWPVSDGCGRFNEVGCFFCVGGRGQGVFRGRIGARYRCMWELSTRRCHSVPLISSFRRNKARWVAPGGECPSDERGALKP